jgi:hypothetical protein
VWASALILGKRNAAGAIIAFVVSRAISNGICAQSGLAFVAYAMVVMHVTPNRSRLNQLAQIGLRILDTR